MTAKKTRHIRKFMGGQMTPEELHAQAAFHPDTKCSGCAGRRPIGRIIVWAPLLEMMKRSPAVAAMSAAAPEELLKHCTKFKESKGDYKGALYVRMSVVYSCKSCFPELEKALAKSTPSWSVVEINRGPGPNKIQVGA